MFEKFRTSTFLGARFHENRKKRWKTLKRWNFSGSNVYKRWIPRAFTNWQHCWVFVIVVNHPPTCKILGIRNKWNLKHSFMQFRLFQHFLGFLRPNLNISGFNNVTSHVCQEKRGRERPRFSFSISYQNNHQKHVFCTRTLRGHRRMQTRLQRIHEKTGWINRLPTDP